MANSKTHFGGIQVPKNIDFSVRINVKHPEKNMQDDVAAFEAWALILHAKFEDGIEMTFNIPPQWNSAFSTEKRIDAEIQHFMRFLFRAWKFREQMEWFSIKDESCQLCVERFKSNFHDIKMTNNIPLRDATPIEKVAKPKDEYILENTFVKHKEAMEAIIIPSNSQELILPSELYNQLPTGLFIDPETESNKQVICEDHKVFPTGFFDLWGVNSKNELCIFELKKGDNLKAGIISELYFYANYANEVFLSDRFNRGNSTHRGYDVLKEAITKGITKIQACFLAPQFHSEISKRKSDIQKFLNNGTGKIAYHFLTFDQEAITNFSGCLPTK